MNVVQLGRLLGAVSPEAFRRHELDRQIRCLEHDLSTSFSFSAQAGHGDEPPSTSPFSSVSYSTRPAHQVGATALAADSITGQYLVSSGADASIRLWDLEAQPTPPYAYLPCASLTRSTTGSHTHSITSLSIYPFDATATTLLSTSHDKSFMLTSITPTSLEPVHTFLLSYSPYCHAVSPVPDASPLVAVGTQHPAVTLLDLHSGLSTHSLPGHNGSIYSLAWSPRQAHILASGSADGRVLFFDIRRANAAFASLDLDDAIGVLGETAANGNGRREKVLDWNTRAHSGPVTGVIFTQGGEKLVTAGHDQRIRVWDMHTGRNDLVHFGPRIRNERIGELKPWVSPGRFGRSGKELVFWPNDDSKGEIWVHGLREGDVKGVMRMKGVARGEQGKVERITSAGRINDMVFRYSNLTEHGHGLEMFTAHGDGRIVNWKPKEELDPDEETTRQGPGVREEKNVDKVAERKKRKREMLGDLVQGLTKRQA